MANEGFRFVNWTDAEGNVISESNPYVFEVTKGRHGDADYFGNLCHDVVNKQQLQSIAGASGYGIFLLSKQLMTAVSKLIETESYFFF